MRLKLLVAEDNVSLASLFRRALTESGFDVDVSHTGEQALVLARKTPYEVVLLDWNLPGQDGVSVCRNLRQMGSDAFIVMVSVRCEVWEKVFALDAGADEYLVKPVDLRELVARMRALERRGGARQGLRGLAGIRLDARDLSLTVDGEPVELTHREFRLLSHLLRRAGETVERGDIIADVWFSGRGPASNVLDVYIRRLRAKLGRAGAQLKTVRGVGYRFEVTDDQRLNE